MSDERTEVERQRTHRLRRVVVGGEVRETCLGCNESIRGWDRAYAMMARDEHGREYMLEFYCDPCGEWRANL